jgi:hypothetical protein
MMMMMMIITMEAKMAHFDILPHYPEGAEKNHEEPQSV